MKGVRQGIKKIHVVDRNRPKSRRPLTWEMVKELEGCAAYWGVERKGVLMDLVLLYILQLRASELFAEDGGVPRYIACGGEILRSFEGTTRCLWTEWKRGLR